MIFNGLIISYLLLHSTIRCQRSLIFIVLHSIGAKMIFSHQVIIKVRDLGVIDNFLLGHVRASCRIIDDYQLLNATRFALRQQMTIYSVKAPELDFLIWKH